MNMEMTGHRIEPTILREYDIRGVVGETLSNEDARAIGRAFGTAVVEKGGNTVCITGIFLKGCINRRVSFFLFCYFSISFFDCCWCRIEIERPNFRGLNVAQDE